MIKLAYATLKMITTEVCTNMLDYDLDRVGEEGRPETPEAVNV